MFTVHGDVIYFDGKAFAVITATAVKSGGWTIDARETLDRHSSIGLDDFADFHTTFTRDVGDKIESALSEAVGDLWLPEAFTKPLTERLTARLVEFFKDEAEQNLGIECSGN